MARTFAIASSQNLRNASYTDVSFPFALVAWFQTSNDTAIQIILSVGNTNGFYHSLEIHGDIADDPIWAKSYDGQSTYAELVGITVNTWHHGCALFEDDSNVRALLDGSEATGGPTQQTVGTIDGISIGVSGDNTPYGYLDGTVCESAVYDVSVYAGATASDKCDTFRDTTLVALAKGYSPLCVPLGLISYYPLIRDEDQDRVGGYDVTPINSPTIGIHAPVIYPTPPFLSFPAPEEAAGLPSYRATARGILRGVGRGVG